jgi:hypothetical protein
MKFVTNHYFFSLTLKQKVCGHKHKHNYIMETSQTRLVITQGTYLISRGKGKLIPLCDTFLNFARIMWKSD